MATSTLRPASASMAERVAELREKHGDIRKTDARVNDIVVLDLPGCRDDHLFFDSVRHLRHTLTAPSLSAR